MSQQGWQACSDCGGAGVKYETRMVLCIDCRGAGWCEQYHQPFNSNDNSWGRPGTVICSYCNGRKEVSQYESYQCRSCYGSRGRGVVEHDGGDSEEQLAAPELQPLTARTTQAPIQDSGGVGLIAIAIVMAALYFGYKFVVDKNITNIVAHFFSYEIYISGTWQFATAVAGFLILIWIIFPIIPGVVIYRNASDAKFHGFRIGRNIGIGTTEVFVLILVPLVALSAITIMVGISPQSDLLQSSLLMLAASAPVLAYLVISAPKLRRTCSNLRRVGICVSGIIVAVGIISVQNIWRVPGETVPNDRLPTEASTKSHPDNNAMILLKVVAPLLAWETKKDQARLMSGYKGPVTGKTVAFQQRWSPLSNSLVQGAQVAVAAAIALLGSFLCVSGLLASAVWQMLRKSWRRIFQPGLSEVFLRPILFFTFGLTVVIGTVVFSDPPLTPRIDTAIKRTFDGTYSGTIRGLLGVWLLKSGSLVIQIGQRLREQVPPQLILGNR